jgi:nucleotide-binding universal stress UspA family protein
MGIAKAGGAPRKKAGPGVGPAAIGSWRWPAHVIGLEVFGMFKKILLPVDLTNKHQPALAIAGDLAALSGGEVILLHVIETIPGLSMEEEQPFYKQLERKAQAHLDRLGKHLKQRKVRCRTEVRFGNRAQESARYATETTADLLVLSAPHFDPAVPAAGWGSMSYRIGILSPCPVLLVK